MKLKKLILLQLTLFLGLATMVACERDEAKKLSAANELEKTQTSILTSPSLHKDTQEK